MSHYIYALTDSENNIRYIGRAMNPRKRYNVHMCRSKSNFAKTHKENWIRKMLSSGRLPIMKILRKVDGLEKAKILERVIIKFFKEKGYNLTNSTSGGDGSLGLKHTEETKAKISKIRQEIMTPELRIKYGNIRRGQTMPESAKKTISLKNRGENSKDAKITNEIARYIKTMQSYGMKQPELFKTFKDDSVVTKYIISKIYNNITWKHINLKPIRNK